MLTIKITLKIITKLTLLCVLLIVLLTAFVLSPPGLKLAAIYAGRLVKSETGLNSGLSGMRWSFRPLTLHVSQFELARDHETPFIVLENMRLSFLRFSRDFPVSAAADITHFLPPVPGIGYFDDSAALSGRFLLDGSLAAPRAVLTLQSGAIRPRDDRYWDGPPAGLWFSILAADGRLVSEMRLDGLPGQPLAARLDLPVDATVRPFRFGFRPDGSVSGSLSAATDLGALSRLLVLDVHRLHGTFTAAMSLDGTVDEPHFTGGIGWQGGYENERTGTILRNIELLMGASRDRLVIERAAAVDGARGSITAAGDVLLRHGRTLPYEFVIQLDDLELMRTDTAVASGSGKLTLKGSSEAAMLQGALVISPLEINIPERIGATAVALPVREINLPPGRMTVPAAEPQAINYPFGLDVRIDIPDRAYVRGRGLDSEWGGRLHIDGNISRPVVSGEFSVIRGRFMFFGRRLVIRRGRIMLDGAFPPAPILDVAAVVRTAGITANMELSGSLAAPVVALYSVPELPEDELLARLLFGRDVARISPLQALTMARAASTLRGRRSTVDLLGEGRRLLHVDQLDIREAETEGEQPVVSVGKYLGDRIYLEFERGLGIDASRAVMQIELTPRISLETEAGTEADAGLGLLWTWEY